MEEETTYLVIVSGCTRPQAEVVMAERIGPDEDYGFPYSIRATLVDSL